MKNIRRCFDVLASLFIFFILSTPLIFIILFACFFLGSPVFFYQFRIGMNGKPFKIVKFRTMSNVCDSSGHLLPDSERLIPFGIFLRFTSLDEIPQLWNVLKGDMSLVGPRPLLVEYLSLYTDEQVRRHEVRPGITGWAQVNGRNDLSWEEKFNLDVWYVDNQSMLLDIKILLITIKKVFTRDGVCADGEVTMSKFKGSE